MSSRFHLRLKTATTLSTQAAAAALESTLLKGDLLVLVGGLGTGKTVFVQGLCASLGVIVPVTSPTFALAHRYEGRLPINHLDVYRIKALEETQDLALAELLEEGITLIEWGDLILPVLPTDRLEVRFTFGEDEDVRIIELTAVGERWLDRVDSLRVVFSDWSV